LIAIPTNHSDAHADSTDPDEIAHMKFDRTKVEGVVTQLKSGLYTVRTPTGTNYTLAELVDVRYGQNVPMVGDEMMPFIGEGNHVMDSRKKGMHTLSPQFISGRLVSINYGVSQMTVMMSGGKKRFKLRPESRMFRDIAVDTPVTFAVNEVGEVIALHADGTSDMPRNGLSHYGNKSALKSFRHLGKHE
jgi:hypothetical protein